MEKEYIDSIGKCTIGYGSDTPQEIEIEKFYQFEYTDGRVCIVYELEDDTFILRVENPATSGRLCETQIRLSRDSFIGLMGVMAIFFSSEVGDIGEILKWTMGGELKYRFLQRKHQ